MQYTTCDFPGCVYNDKNKGLSIPKGMINISVRIGYGYAEKRFDLCPEHAKALGLDIESKTTIEDDLLQTLTEFVQASIPDPL